MNKFLDYYYKIIDKKARREVPSVLVLFTMSSLLDVVGLGAIGVFFNINCE